MRVQKSAKECLNIACPSTYQDYAFINSHSGNTVLLSGEIF